MGEIETGSLFEFVNFIKKISESKKTYIYGAGTYGKIIGSFFKKYQINYEGFIDSNKKLMGSFLFEKQIYGLSDISEYSNCVVILSLSRQVYGQEFSDLYLMLCSIGVNKANIVYFADDFDLMDSIIRSVKDTSHILQRNLKLKNIFSGKRCFIIGNGPSLLIEDINRLKTEISMGCNGIYQLFEKSVWRPTCFFAEDNVFLNEHVQTDKDLKYLLCNCEYLFTTLWSELYDRYLDEFDKLFYLHTCKTKIEDIMFSPDLTQKIYSALTTLYTMLQVAVYMGINEIYLLGVDFTFRREIDKNGNMLVRKDMKNHAEIMEETDGIYHTDIILKGYMVAKKYADLHGIKIYNATRGGKLEVFERVNFDDLF